MIYRGEVVAKHVSTTAVHVPRQNEAPGTKTERAEGRYAIVMMCFSLTTKRWFRVQRCPCIAPHPGCRHPLDRSRVSLWGIRGIRYTAVHRK